MKKLKILMLHLSHGGVEKQTITMANALASDYDIEIVSFYKIENNPAYEINKKIKVKYLYDGKPNKEEFKMAVKKLNLFKVLKEGIKAVKILYLKKKLIIKEIKKDDADIYFSTRCEYGCLLSKYGNKDKVKLTQEHNFIDDDKYKNKIVKGYQNLDYIIVISKWHEKTYLKWFSASKPKIVRIENVLDNVSNKKSKLNNNSIIAVGRFDLVKDFVGMIEIMKYLVELNSKIKLYLLGNGIEKVNIENKIKEYNLEEHVILPGFVSAEEVQEYMLKSDIYIMTSFRECFPMVLLEAYSCGLPVISFDILSGPVEIVKDGVTGYLIENRNYQKMAEKINDLLNNKKQLSEFGKNAVEESKKYYKDIIINKWKKLFK